MAVNGKQKGARFELKKAKDITKWWNEGTFNRVPASGGLHWASDQRVAGDIVPPPKADFPFVIELKHREGWSIEHILLDIGEPKEWWAQVVNDARRVELTPMLIFTRNRAKEFVMVPYTGWLYNELRTNNTDVMKTVVTIKNIRDEIQSFDVIVTTYDTIIQVDKEDLKFYAKHTQWDDYADEYK